ncbi:MAG TPA: hypothetical protein VFE05_07465 [Longimicrobiaceae bacterium]|jgi:hypothetical protein|nr:hypothetical protein [Longimicrobiaceae bacterium]
MMKLTRSAKITTLALGLGLMLAPAAKAMDLCGARESSNVIDCRSGTCVQLPGYTPTAWETFKCEVGRLFS